MDAKQQEIHNRCRQIALDPSAPLSKSARNKKEKKKRDKLISFRSQIFAERVPAKRKFFHFHSKTS